MKTLFVLLMLLLPTAFAQKAYFGISADAAYIFDLATETVLTDAAIVSAGAQLGVRDLLGPFGLRLTGDYSVYPASGLLEVGGDVLFHFGTVIDPYLGIGAGVLAFNGQMLGMGRAFLGIAPRLNSSFGLFGEALLDAYSDGTTPAFTVKGRAGLNFFF